MYMFKKYLHVYTVYLKMTYIIYKYKYTVYYIYFLNIYIYIYIQYKHTQYTHIYSVNTNLF